jgi:PRC-barrel domain
MNPNAVPYSHDQVEQGPEERLHGGQPAGPDGQLAELRQLNDYVIGEGNPDIRGWEVRTAAGLGDRTVGRVEDLLVDRDTLSVRYILVCLDKGAVATTRDRRILVPVGVGRLDEHDDRVRLDGYTSAQLVGIPEFRPGKVTRHYETIVTRRFTLPAPTAGPQRRHSAGFYDRSEFDERSLWGARRRGHEDLPYLTRHGHAD